MEPDGNHLRVGAANSVPDAYNEACKHGIPVGDLQGSCGTAAFRRKAVIVADIETDPLWDVPPRPLVIAMGLRACWSMPILDDDGAVLGTVAMYYNERREQKFRIDKLKIDRSFIARLGEADDATIIIRTIVGLAHNLGLCVTAEGVETPEQLALVREFTCEEAQGFLLGRSLPMGAPSELSSARVRQDFGRVNGTVRRSQLATTSKAVAPGS
jgi:hypothetical protein